MFNKVAATSNPANAHFFLQISINVQIFDIVNDSKVLISPPHTHTHNRFLLENNCSLIQLELFLLAF